MSKQSSPGGSLPFSESNRERLLRRLRRHSSLLVWAAVLIVTVMLFQHRRHGAAVTGFAVETRYDVAGETAGRLETLAVDINQNVVRGQVIASFAGEDLMLDLREARAELDRLACELEREGAMWDLDASGQQVEQQTNLRRFARDAENARIDYLQAAASLAADRIELQGLETTLGRTRALTEGDLTSRATLDDDRYAFETLRESVAGGEVAVAALREAKTKAEARYREYEARYLAEIPEAEVLLRPLESAMTVQEVRIEKVQLAIGRLVLRAPAAGALAAIFHRDGEVVAAGEPVASIVEPRSGAVVAYLPETRIRAAADIVAGDEVALRRAGTAGPGLAGAVASVGASVERLPLRLDPAAAVPGWGLAVRISLPDSLKAMPGERFEVSF